jgi:repressor LexA
MRPLTKRQLDCLRAIDSFIRERGFSPSLRELGRALGIASTNATNDLVRGLKRSDMVTSETGWARTLRVSTKGAALLHHLEFEAPFCAEAAVEELGL